MRKWDWIGITRYHSFLLKNPKIIAFPGLSTEKLIKKLHKVKFILPLSKKDGWFYNQRLTGSIPFAMVQWLPTHPLDKRNQECHNCASSQKDAQM